MIAWDNTGWVLKQRDQHRMIFPLAHKYQRLQKLDKEPVTSVRGFHTALAVTALLK